MATAGRGSPSGMRLFQAQTDDPNLTEMMRAIEQSTTNTIGDILRFAGADVVAYLKGYTNVMRPPRYERKFALDKNSRRYRLPDDRSQWRPAHPGGWADVEGDLRDAYFAGLVFEQGGWKLIVGNRDGAAAFVEAKHGYFVISGILEAQGPVARSIRRAITALGLKGWKVIGVAGSIGNYDRDQLVVRPTTGDALPPDVGAP